MENKKFFCLLALIIIAAFVIHYCKKNFENETAEAPKYELELELKNAQNS